MSSRPSGAAARPTRGRRGGRSSRHDVPGLLRGGARGGAIAAGGGDAREGLSRAFCRRAMGSTTALGPRPCSRS